MSRRPTCSAGYAEAFLRLGVLPDIIVLRRPLREIAQPLLRLNSVPARTGLGLYLLRSTTLVCCRFSAGHRSNHQLCFWYALEIERRQLRYTQIFAELGRRIVEVTLGSSRLRAVPGGSGPAGFFDHDALDLEERFERLVGTRHNSTGDGPVEGIDADSTRRRASLGRRSHYEPTLRPGSRFGMQASRHRPSGRPVSRGALGGFLCSVLCFQGCSPVLSPSSDADGFEPAPATAASTGVSDPSLGAAEAHRVAQGTARARRLDTQGRRPVDDEPARESVKIRLSFLRAHLETRDSPVRPRHRPAPRAGTRPGEPGATSNE